MNRISRMLMMSGLGIATSLSLGMVPASAAPATSQGAVTSVTTVDRDWDDDDDYEFKGWFRDRDDCREQGRRGIRRDWWEDYECKRVGWGHRARYALWVEEDDDDDHDWSIRRRG